MARSIQLPDGRTIELTGSETPEQLSALKEKLSTTFAPQEQPGTIPQEPMGEFQRMLGRAGRNVAAAAGGAADLGLLPLKTLASGAEVGLEALGLEGSGVERFAERVRTTPPMREAVLGMIDEPTGGQLQPRGAIESITDFAVEIGAPTGAVLGKLSAIEKQKDMFDMVRKSDPRIGEAIRQVAFDDPDEALSAIIKAKSQGLYDEAEKAGGALGETVVEDFLTKVTRAIKRKTEAGAMVAGKDDAADALLDRLSTLRGKRLSLDEAKDIDEVLGEMMTKDTFINSATGKLNASGRKVSRVQDALRETIENALPDDILGGREGFDAFKRARKLWSNSLKARDVERIVERGKMMDQPANAIRSGFRTLYNNPKRMKGYTKAERAAIKKAANTNLFKDILRVPASRLGSVVGLGTGNPALAAALTPVGMAGRGVGEAFQTSQASKILGLLAKESGILPQSAPNIAARGAAFTPAALGTLRAQQ